MSLSVFQIVALGVLLALFATTVFGAVRHWLGRGESLLACVVWVVGVVAVLWPEATTDVARVVGIRRGADLLLYCATVVMMVGFLMTYIRLRRLRRDVTLLTRNIAIRDAHTGEPESSGGPASK